MQNLDPKTMPTPTYLLQIAARDGQAEVVRYLFDTLLECRLRKPWSPAIPEGINSWNDIPRKWRIGEDFVIFNAIEGTDPIAIFQVFFDYGMSPNYNLERMISPLALAIPNRLELAKFLLEKGANPNGHYTFVEETFLCAAARAQKPDMIDLFIKHGARIQGSNALQDAAAYRRICNAERLLELGANINEVFKKTEHAPISEPNVYSRDIVLGSALHCAVKGGTLNFPVTDSPADMVRFLLERGARTDIVDGNGKTALQVARRAGMRDVIKVFEEYAKK